MGDLLTASSIQSCTVVKPGIAGQKLSMLRKLDCVSANAQFNIFSPSFSEGEKNLPLVRILQRDRGQLLVLVWHSAQGFCMDTNAAPFKFIAKT